MVLGRFGACRHMDLRLGYPRRVYGQPSKIRLQDFRIRQGCLCSLVVGICTADSAELAILYCRFNDG